MFVKFICIFKSDWGNSAAAVQFYKLIFFRCLHVFICSLFYISFSFSSPSSRKKMSPSPYLDELRICIKYIIIIFLKIKTGSQNYNLEYEDEVFFLQPYSLDVSDFLMQLSGFTHAYTQTRLSTRRRQREARVRGEKFVSNQRPLLPLLMLLF